MSTPSLKARFKFSLVSNACRGIMTFLTGLLIARGLGPEKYGDFVFLLGSFMALRQLLDLGSSRAFFTFMSQKIRDKLFVGSFVVWQLVQFFLPLLAISFIFPGKWIDGIWMGQEKNIVVLAFIAVFMRQNAWQMMIHIGESYRLTYRVQLMNLAIAVLHFILVVSLWQINWLSIKILFGLIILEYLISIGVGYRVLFVGKLESKEFDGKKVLNDYKLYCGPLIIYSLIGFSYEFADRWLLQKFGGSLEQGFYGVAYQFAAVGLLATISILNILWKEISEALEKEDLERVRTLYFKVSRLLFMMGAFLSCFLVPWATDIIKLLLGDEFVKSAPVLCIMFLYPIHQTLGQINGVMLLATGRTKIKALIGGLIMAISIPITYWVLAPSNAWIPGLGLGSIGIALKMVLIQILGVNLTIWWIARYYKWKFDWVYQVFGLVVGLGIGFMAFWLSQQVIMDVKSILIIKMSVAFFVYTSGMALFVWFFPWVAGLTRHELKGEFLKLI